jgi:hypothetical protein
VDENRRNGDGVAAAAAKAARQHRKAKIGGAPGGGSEAKANDGGGVYSKAENIACRRKRENNKQSAIGRSQAKYGNGWINWRRISMKSAAI